MYISNVLPYSTLTNFHFISAEEIVEFITSDKTLMTTLSYVGKYTKPLDVVLDQELIWPLEVRLFPYMWKTVV